MKITKPAILALAVLATSLAQAQGSFPARPITIVVPYPAGGTSDAQVRLFQDMLSKELGQPIIVENKPGASGALAANAVARAKPDGYTLLYPNNGLLIAPLLNKKAGYDAFKDFKPVSLTTSVPMVLVVNRKTQATDAASFLQYARNQPDGIMYASAGTASYGHLATARLAQMADIKVEHIPYKGEAGTTMAVSAGEVQMLLTTPSAAMLGQVSQGNLTLLGVATEGPSPVVPGAPTLNKVIPGFTSEVWFGLLAPSGTPDQVIGRVNAAVVKTMADASIRSRLLPTGALARSSTPAEFGALMKKESAQWEEVIRKFNIRAD